MCEEAFEPDTPNNPADPMAVIAELRGELEESDKARSGLLADLRGERERRHEAEKRAAFAERERTAALRYAEQISKTLESLLAAPPQPAEPEINSLAAQQQSIAESIAAAE